jgi:1,4-alpha-glucan branching enzyme
MFDISEVGPEFKDGKVRFRIYLPNVDANRGFKVRVFHIRKQDQFDPAVSAKVVDLGQSPIRPGDPNPTWGDLAKNLWVSSFIDLAPDVYLYRFEIVGPATNGGQTRSLYFGDPCAHETDAGVFSVLRVGPNPAQDKLADGSFQVPALADLVLYEINVPEFAGTFDGIADRISYLKSLGVNAIELMPISSVAEPSQWGYMDIFYFAPEERFGGATGLKRMVGACHQAGIAVVLDVVFAHADRMFPYQIGYDRFFDLWWDPDYTDATGLHRAPNPMVSRYENFGKKNDWRMKSTKEFFEAVTRFWLEEYRVDGFRFDHVNGYLDRIPTWRDGKVDWYSQENRPTFVSLQDLSKSIYAVSKTMPRFGGNGEPSRIIQIAEDLSESAYQLSPNANSAINGCWEKRLRDIVKEMAKNGSLDGNLGTELLLADSRFDKQGYTGLKAVGADTIAARPVLYLDSHDDCRLFYLMQNGQDCSDPGYEYRNGLDGQPWWKLQPFAIALMTSVGIPMLWQGQEFAENTGLATDGNVRVRAYRPIHWDYFYMPEEDSKGLTVLPLVTLYRHLGYLRHALSALRGGRTECKQEYCNSIDKVLVYRRWSSGEVVIVGLNFSDTEQSVDIPFGELGTWRDELDAKYEKPGEAYSVTVTDRTAKMSLGLPSHFGRILRLLPPS